MDESIHVDGVEISEIGVEILGDINFGDVIDDMVGEIKSEGVVEIEDTIVGGHTHDDSVEGVGIRTGVVDVGRSTLDDSVLFHGDNEAAVHIRDDRVLVFYDDHADI